MSKEETKEVKEETKEEVVEGAAEEKKEPSSDEIIEGLKAELDKAKNDVARAYADTENMKKTSTERCRCNSKISLPTASNGNLANS